MENVSGGGLHSDNDHNGVKMQSNALTFGQRIYEWLSRFHVDVYRGVQPSGVNVSNLYLLINGYVDNFANSFVFPVQIYARNTSSFSSVLQIAEDIEDAVGESGVLVIYNDIRFKIEKGSPFYQDRPIENETVRSGYINLEITIY